MSSFNDIVIVGYLGRDPELRTTQAGKSVCSFSVATGERRKDRNGDFKEITTWFRCTAWERTAELANEYLQKGSQVYIRGPLIQNEYQDRDGVTRTSLEVTVRDMKFLSKADDNNTSRRSSERSSREEREEHQPSQGGGSPPVTEDDIPFAWIIGFIGSGWVLAHYAQAMFQMWQG